MYAPYVSLVKKLFPNAQLIIDRFHIVQHIGRTFFESPSERNHGTTQRNFPLSTRTREKLKRYWKLLQRRRKVKLRKRIWRASFKDYLTESEIVDRLLAACPNLLRLSSYTKTFFMR